jgi:hypothetical protein
VDDADGKAYVVLICVSCDIFIVSNRSIQNSEFAKKAYVYSSMDYTFPVCLICYEFAFKAVTV